MVKGKILCEAILYDLYGAKLVQQLALKVGKKVETSSINLWVTKTWREWHVVITF